MADEPDILRRDSPQRHVPRWLRPLAVLLAVCVGAGWFALTRDDKSFDPAAVSTPPIEPIDGEPGRDCGPANGDGLAWSAPSAVVQPDGRLVIWRIHLCNRGGRDVTVEVELAAATVGITQPCPGLSVAPAALTRR